ncbi:MAG: hypothetical protein JWM09_537 [Francisellaceae bacterium]|nr:hypothetical protein [Francisellaceae bacterium]
MLLITELCDPINKLLQRYIDGGVQFLENEEVKTEKIKIVTGCLESIKAIQGNKNFSSDEIFLRISAQLKKSLNDIKDLDVKIGNSETCLQLCQDLLNKIQHTIKIINVAEPTNKETAWYLFYKELCKYLTEVEQKIITQHLTISPVEKFNKGIFGAVASAYNYFLNQDYNSKEFKTARERLDMIVLKQLKCAYKLMKLIKNDKELEYQIIINAIDGIATEIESQIESIDLKELLQDLKFKINNLSIYNKTFHNEYKKGIILDCDLASTEVHKLLGQSENFHFESLPIEKNEKVGTKTVQSSPFEDEALQEEQEMKANENNALIENEGSYSSSYVNQQLKKINDSLLNPDVQKTNSLINKQLKPDNNKKLVNEHSPKAPVSKISEGSTLRRVVNKIK